MALIKINNTMQAISDAEELTTITTKIDSVRDSLDYILSEIAQYWEQTQQDAQAFSKKLEENTASLQEVVNCNKEFSQVIIKYAENQEKTAQKTVS